MRQVVQVWVCVWMRVRCLMVDWDTPSVRLSGGPFHRLHRQPSPGAHRTAS